MLSKNFFFLIFLICYLTITTKRTGYCFTKNDDVTAMFFEGMLIITPPFLGCALMGIIVFCLKFKFNLFSWLRTNIALENDEVNATANGHSMPSSSSSSTLRSPFTMFTIMIILGFLRFANHVMFLYFNFNRSFYSKATSGVIFVLSSVRIMRTLSHSPYLFVYFKHHLEFRQTALGLMSKVRVRTKIYFFKRIKVSFLLL